jgi:hypothetical protein
MHLRRAALDPARHTIIYLPDPAIGLPYWRKNND